MLALLFLSAFGTVSLWAKSSEDYFHGAASMYVEGRMQQAKIEVEEGLRQFPEDNKLKALAEQLKKLEDQQKQDNQNQSGGDNQENQDNKEKQEQDQNQDSNSQEEDKKEDSKDQDSKEEEKDKQEEESQGEQNQEEEKQPPQDSTSQGQAPPEQGEMSEEEAKRLLDNYKNDEKEELKNLKKKIGRRGKPVKDW